ncbi:hypothetical protein F5B22DRAFT_612303 [Xylaria bambusicola]|uniref:uncharacterized protein n=1 Tax=Xylaria bambusicola TaxID=326684 RepID=UPI002007C2D9|nr:uncharacterized protein F5B22DRAFT_612303 [Xylaria bambusicola]KAI0513110.1 hypothetical protein F5B22DRAFT_612303 [Xylaria bambusicola]
MEDSGAGTPDGGDTSSSEPPHGGDQHPEVVVISEHGDVVLDVTFQNSKDTIRAARKAVPVRPTGRTDPQPQQPVPKARVRLAFRVDLAVLRGQSKYFDKLLGDAHFKEAKDIADAFAALSLKKVQPRDADAKDLPWISIHDDDEATSYAYREMVFADLLRILHGQDAKTGQAQITMSFVTTLAVLADRFDCAAAVSKYVATGLKFKWPVTNRGKLSSARDDSGGASFSGMSRTNENVLRQKILVSWLLNQPGKFQAATRELIMNGSCQWSSFGEQEDESTSATWWYLQDGLEQELQYRRNSVLNTLASVPRHFLMLYTSSRSARQCKLGYDSSVACDSYQLGEMFKFLANKGLLFLVDFSPGSLDVIADTALLPVDHILSTLRQCPAYQIDKNHTNCGLRTRLLPILDFIQALLSANSIPISRAAWKNGRAAHAWMPADVDGKADGVEKPFRFTRALAADQRLRFENAMGADKFARDVFTATSWDWTAEEQGQDHVSTTPRWSFR